VIGSLTYTGGQAERWRQSNGPVSCSDWSSDGTW